MGISAYPDDFRSTQRCTRDMRSREPRLVLDSSFHFSSGAGAEGCATSLCDLSFSRRSQRCFPSFLRPAIAHPATARQYLRSA